MIDMRYVAADGSRSMTFNTILAAKLQFLLPRHTRITEVNGSRTVVLNDLVAFAFGFADLVDLKWLEHDPTKLKWHRLLKGPSENLCGRGKPGYRLDVVPVILCLLGFVVTRSDWQEAREGPTLFLNDGCCHAWRWKGEERGERERASERKRKTAKEREREGAGARKRG